VVNGSQSCHCCFEFTVVDKTKPVMINGEHYENRFEPLCECFDQDEAEQIADALNRTAMRVSNEWGYNHGY
jgi:hypothetical protein